MLLEGGPLAQPAIEEHPRVAHLDGTGGVHALAGHHAHRDTAALHDRDVRRLVVLIPIQHVLIM